MFLHDIIGLIRTIKTMLNTTSMQCNFLDGTHQTRRSCFSVRKGMRLFSLGIIE